MSRLPFEPLVALRFLREGRAQTWLIFIGVGVGVGVMVFVSALISGLQSSLIKNTLSIQAHIVVRPKERSPIVLRDPESALVAATLEKGRERVARIDAWQPIAESVSKIPGVSAVAPTVAGSAFAHQGALNASVALRGIDDASYEGIINLKEKLKSGRYELVGNNGLIGTELASNLGLAVGDRLTIRTTANREDVLRVTGIFDLGNKDVNQRWVFVSVREAQSLLDLTGSVSTFEVRINDPFLAEPIAENIRQHTALEAEPWTILNRQLLVALKSQSSSSMMIQVFVILAVALGIASVLVVSVVQKSKEIGILRATGTSIRSITWIFLIQGLVVGFVGAIVGSLLGAFLAFLFSRMAVSADGSPTFPVDLGPELFFRAFAVAIGVGLISAVSPARRAAKLDPAVAIRHA
jgi:lipoprotein-releasing system permease protein